MTDTSVPAFPNVLIIVTDAAVMVDGEVVDRGSAGGPDASVAIHLGVHAAARRVAQRVGRPVRATLRSNGEEKRIIVHPDGTFWDAEEVKPSVGPGVSVAAPGSRSIPVRRPARRPVRAVFLVDRTRLGMVAAYVALGAVLVGGLLVQANSDDPAPMSTGADLPPAAPEQVDDPAPLVPQAVVDGSRLERLPGIREVDASPDAGGFQLRVTTSRAVSVEVLAAPLSGDDGARLWTLRTSGAMTRTLDISDLAAGAYRWEVRLPGEQPQTGNVVVPPAPESPPADTDEPVVPVDTSTPPDDGPSSGDDDGNDDGGPGPGAGPTGPVDPDDLIAP